MYSFLRNVKIFYLHLLVLHVGNFSYTYNFECEYILMYLKYMDIYAYL